MMIHQTSRLSIHFDIRLKDGSIAQSTRDVGVPMSFQMGQGIFTEKLEDKLIGLKVGDKVKVMLLPEDAFGEVHPGNIYHIPISHFQNTPLEGTLEPGLIVGFTQPNGQELPGIIRQVEEEAVTVDFNHPLAGQVVLFDIEIMGVE